MKRTYLSLCMAFSLVAASAQYVTPYVYKLIDSKDYQYIANEMSGENAIAAASDMASYERVNRDFETLFESNYIYQKCKEYGLSEVTMYRYQRNDSAWVPLRASLWEVSPYRTKLADVVDIPASLVVHSADANVKARLVWMHRNATDAQRELLNLKGNILVTEMNTWAAAQAAIKYGAVGFVTVGNPRPLVDPTQLANSGMSRSGLFAFQMTPREGYPLRDRLMRGDSIWVKADVRVKYERIESQTPTCCIPGSDPDGEEIIFSAHLFEGYNKLGANDNISGSVALLEAARTLQVLINRGEIERPKRTLRFVWGDEFIGIIPWTNERKDIMAKSLYNINLDMVGIGLARQGSYMNMHRTTMANSHYANDLLENLMRYLGATNQGSILLHPTPTTQPLYAPTGSTDPFYFSLTSHYGASDHEVFNDWGVQVPGMMMITWPDHKYHTSADRIAELDPTQMKRAAVLAATLAYIGATADERDAVKIGAEVAGNSLRRLAMAHNRVASEMSATPRNRFAQFYRNASAILSGTLLAEKLTIASIRELAPKSEMLERFIHEQCAAIDQHGVSLQASLLSVARATDPTIAPVQLTEEEEQAAKLFPASTPKVLEEGYGVTGKVADKRSMIRSLRVGNLDEACRLTRYGTFSLLDISHMLKAQYSNPVVLADLRTLMETLQEEGLVAINPNRK